MSLDKSLKLDLKMSKFLFVCPTESAEEKKQSCLQNMKDKLANLAKFDGATFVLKEGGMVTSTGSGALTVFQGDISSEGMLLAAFAGDLENYPYLVKKYCPETLHVEDPQRLWLEEIRQRHPVSEAELMCILYRKLSTNMVPKLRGNFAFVILDAAQNKVLAAVDSKGTFKLQQATLSDGSLIIACGDCMPKGAQDIVRFEPGFMKYGFDTPPRKYSSSEEARKNAAKEAHNVAASALSGLNISAAQPKSSPKSHLQQKLAYEFEEPDRRFTNYEQPRWSKPQFPETWVHTIPSPPMTQRSHPGSYHKISPYASPFVPQGPPPPPPPPPPLPLPQTYHQDQAFQQHNDIINALQFDAQYNSILQQSLSSDISLTHQKSESDASIECSGIMGEAVAALSTLPKSLLDNLAGGNTDEPARLNSVIDLLLNDNTPITVTDAQIPDNPVIFANPAFLSITGYPLTSIIGMNLRFLQSPPGQPRVPSVTSMVVRKSLEDGAPKRIRILNYSRYGVALQNDMMLIPVYENNVVTHWLGILQFTPAEDNTPINSARGIQNFTSIQVQQF